jgi:ApbE superfamily uncharacterized protein (UPF0280 family)
MMMKEFWVRYKKTSLRMICDKDLEKDAKEELVTHYNLLENYIRRNPLFLTTYEPLPVEEDAPSIVRIMADAASKTGVGPMASVAGAFSELIGIFLLKNNLKDVLVENGGDIYLKTTTHRVVGVYAGTSEFSEKIGFKIKPDETPLGVCTSSGSVGHSISLGDSDSVTVISKSGSLSDAAATAIGNHVKGREGIEKGIQKAGDIKRIIGVLIIKEGVMASWGRLPELIKT